MNTLRGILLMGLFMTVTVLANQTVTKRTDSPPKKASNPSLGTVSGRIFLITKGGDLKLARMARVYLFWENGPAATAVKAAAGEETSPGLVYLKKYLQATKDANRSGASQFCRSDLLNADKAALATIDWAQEHKLADYIPIIKSDEEGNFSASKLRPGLYELVARGQAGINDAYWLQEVTVKAGEKTEVKVNSVEGSCTDKP